MCHGTLKLEGVSDGWFAVAMNFIESRGNGKISAPVPYFTRAFVNLFLNLASGVSAESDENLAKCINAEYDRSQRLREKYGRNASAPYSGPRRAASCIQCRVAEVATLIP
jgi:hypothetical protein